MICMDLATAHNSNLNIWLILFLNFQLFKNSETATPIDKILVYPNGFICTSGAGTLKNFDAAPGGGYTFQKDLKILIEDKDLEYGILDEQQILDMTLSPVGDVVAVATDKRQVFAAKFKELKRSKEDYYKMKPLFYFLHSSPVHGVDICVRKPLVVTCAADRTIRIWNFYNRDCEVWKKFPEEPHSVPFILMGYICCLVSRTSSRWCTSWMMTLKRCAICRFVGAGRWNSRMVVTCSQPRTARLFRWVSTTFVLTNTDIFRFWVARS